MELRNEAHRHPNVGSRVLVQSPAHLASRSGTVTCLWWAQQAAGVQLEGMATPVLLRWTSLELVEHAPAEVVSTDESAALGPRRRERRAGRPRVGVAGRVPDLPGDVL